MEITAVGGRTTRPVALLAGGQGHVLQRYSHHGWLSSWDISIEFFLLILNRILHDFTGEATTSSWRRTRRTSQSTNWIFKAKPSTEGAPNRIASWKPPASLRKSQGDHRDRRDRHPPRNYPVPISTLGHPRWKVEHVWTHHWDKMCVEAPKMYRNATHKLCFLFQDFETRHCHINMRVSPPKWAHLRIWQIDKIQKTKPWNFVDVPIYIPRYSQTYWWLYRLIPSNRNHSTNSEALQRARLRLCVLTLPRATQGNAPVDEIFTWISWGKILRKSAQMLWHVLTIWSCVVNHAEQHG